MLMKMQNDTPSAFPATMTWQNHPVSYQVTGPDSMTIAAGAGTEWFVDLIEAWWNKDSAPCALFNPPDSAYIFSAKVKVAFESTFDAGVIQVRSGQYLWGKLCFEFSPQGKAMIVSVVTREKSDDCNHVVIDGNEVFLRVSVRPEAVAFHYSTDGKYWEMVRYFTLGDHANLRIGLSAQSPLGKGCVDSFSKISYRAGVLGDNRSGE